MPLKTQFGSATAKRPLSASRLCALVTPSKAILALQAPTKFELVITLGPHDLRLLREVVCVQPGAKNSRCSYSASMTRQVEVPNPYYAFVGVATAAWISLASTLGHVKALRDCAGPLCFWRQLVHQLRPFFFDHLAEIVGNFQEIVSLK